ncbi:MAG TPA: MBL fold metallo-hydrolase [Syntrophorhabdaceae bacterium]|nr:MBL fold metallo-hydrolase [Syntrophorhabdaceae bacterium]
MQTKKNGEHVIEEVAADFYRAEIPLPDSVLKVVNSYVIRDGERNLIIDTGMYNERCFDAMQRAVKKLDVDLEKTDFFVTHSHGDHIGLVYQLVHPGSVVHISEPEIQIISGLQGKTRLLDIEAFLHMSAFPNKDPEKIFPPYAGRQHKSGVTLAFRIVNDGDVFERGGYRFRCVHTPGHSKGHMCLYEPDKKILIAGDHILKDITPGIQGKSAFEDPLADYLASLDKIYALDIDTVLPGHRHPFVNPRSRITAIKEHHRQRNNEVLAILREGSRNVYDLASRMTWNVDADSWDSFPVTQSFFATGEAFAHLRYLEERGEVIKKMEGQVAIYSLNQPR